MNCRAIFDIYRQRLLISLLPKYGKCALLLNENVFLAGFIRVRRYIRRRSSVYLTILIPCFFLSDPKMLILLLEMLVINLQEI